MAKIIHHFEKKRKKNPAYYGSFIYENELWRKTNGQNIQLSSREKLESKTNGPYEYQMADMYKSGFNIAIHHQRPHGEVLWWLRHYYDGMLTHFKTHLYPNQRHNLELPYDGEVLNMPGRRHYSYLRSNDWINAVILALFFNDGAALSLFREFSRDDIALDENAHFMSPFKYAEFDVVKALIEGDDRQTQAAIKAYMSIDLSLNHPADSLRHIQQLDMPLMDCLLAVFCHRGQAQYQEKMANAVKQYMTYSRKENALSLDFPINLLAISQFACRGLGYTFPDHPYLPQWFQTVDVNEIIQPRKVTEQPDEMTWVG